MKRNRWVGWLIALAMAVGAVSTWSAETAALSLDEFLKQIQDKNADARRKAFEQAGPLGAQAIAPLAKLLANWNREGATNEEQDVAKATGTALDMIAHHASRPGADSERRAVNAELLKLIVAGQPEPARIKALFILESTGTDETVPALAALLKDPDAKMRERARAGLERIPGKASSQALLAALASATGDFRRDIILTLGQKKATEAVEALLGEAKSSDAAIRLAAIDALARIGDPKGREAILAAVRELDGMQRKTAVDDYLRLADHLALAGDNQAAMAIYSGVLERSKSDPARCAALVGLGKTGGNESLSAVLGVLADPSAKVRNAAANALINLKGADANQRLVEVTSKAQPAIKAMLLRVLAERKAPEADNLIKQASSDPNMDVRVTALDLLGGLNDPKLEPLLVEAAEKGSPEAKIVALRSYVQLAAARLGANDKAQALTMYHRALDLTDANDVRRSALEGLASIGSAESLPRVEKLMVEGSNVRDDATRAYIAIVAAMGKTGDKEDAIKRLTAVVEASRSQDISARAIAAMRALGAKVAGFAGKVGFITQWWVIGPFPFDGSAPFNKSHIAADKVAVDQPITVGEKTLKWKEVKSDDAQGLVDLNAVLGSASNVAAYAYAEIEIPKERDVNLRIGSDDGFICWVNGKPVGENNATRPVNVDGDTINKVHFVQGTNKILLKVTQGTGDWGFCVRVANTQNRPLDLNRMAER